MDTEPLKDARVVMVWRKKAQLAKQSLDKIISEGHSLGKVERAREYLRDIQSFRKIIPASTRVFSRRDFDSIINGGDIVEMKKTDYVEFVKIRTPKKDKFCTYAWTKPIISL